MQRASQNAVDLNDHYEGMKLSAYLCAADVVTIGVGTTHYENGEPVQLGDTITRARAAELHLNTLAKFEAVVRDALDVSVDQNQFDALVVLAYNIGAKAFRGSTVLRRVNEGRFEDAAAAFTMWVYATQPRTPDGGAGTYRKALRGLLRRRLAEALLFRGLRWDWLTEDEVTLVTHAVHRPDRADWKDEIVEATEWRDVLNRARKVGPIKPAPPRADGGAEPEPIGTAPLSDDTRAIEHVPYGLDPASGAKPMHESQRAWGFAFVAVGHVMRSVGAKLATVSAVGAATLTGFADALAMPAVQAAIGLGVVWAIGAMTEWFGWRTKRRGEKEARQALY